MGSIKFVDALEAACHEALPTIAPSAGGDIPCANALLYGTHFFSLLFLPELQESKGGGDPGSYGHELP